MFSSYWIRGLKNAAPPRVGECSEVVSQNQKGWEVFLLGIADELWRPAGREGSEHVSCPLLGRNGRRVWCSQGSKLEPTIWAPHNLWVPGSAEGSGFCDLLGCATVNIAFRWEEGGLDQVSHPQAFPTSTGLTQRKDFGANCLKEEKPSVWAKARAGNTQRWTQM